MSQTTLASELEALEPADNEAAAIQTFSSAYENYASTATGNGITLTPAGLALGKAAMESGLVGMSVSGTTVIPTACIAFWVAVCTAFAVSFPTSIAATPPPHVALPAAFAALMPLNTTNEVTLEEAAASMASIIHTGAVTGGTVTLPGPTPGPIL
ncbi:MAG: hypothetical protein GY847_06515 [Proteobacteria bacterium]|nr:hypothetical protein [Pseudomonadota bacterium]